jgi:hypothetical protein
MKIGQTKLAKFANKVQAPVRGAVAGKTGTPPVNTGWMTKGSENIASQVETIKIDAQRKFAPEVIIKEGESKRLRFRANDPIGSVRRYTVKVNGRWTSVTQPPEGEPDPFRENNLRSSLKVIWEVVDIDGYKDKTGKQHKMVPRFLVANVRLHEQLEVIRKKRGDLTKYTIEVSRTGSGTQTTYTLLPEAPSPFPEMLKIPSIKGDVAKYYAPLSLAEMESLVARYEPQTD